MSLLTARRFALITCPACQAQAVAVTHAALSQRVTFYCAQCGFTSKHERRQFTHTTAASAAGQVKPVQSFLL